ncbi:myosin heavy chain IB [Cinclus cinclus]|uniref:myosin heavy chain IB n=1 Tax=Cinclus cinclus TaxID=127875 RepID=UPI002E0E639A
MAIVAGVKDRLRWYEGRSQSHRDDQGRQPRRVGTHRGLCRDGRDSEPQRVPLKEKGQNAGNPPPPLEPAASPHTGTKTPPRAQHLPARPRQLPAPEVSFGEARRGHQPPAAGAGSAGRGGRAALGPGGARRRRRGRGGGGSGGAGCGCLRLPPAASRRGARSGAAAGSAHHPAAARERRTRTEVTAGAFRGVIGSVRGCPPARPPGLAAVAAPRPSRAGEPRPKFWGLWTGGCRRRAAAPLRSVSGGCPALLPPSRRRAAGPATGCGEG